MSTVDLAQYECPLEQQDGQWVCPRCGFAFVVHVRRWCPKLAPAEFLINPNPVTPVQADAAAQHGQLADPQSTEELTRQQQGLREKALAAKRASILTIVQDRWREDPDVRTMAEIEELLDKHLPNCPCRDAEESYATDLLYRSRWRKDWGPKP